MRDIAFAVFRFYIQNALFLTTATKIKHSPNAMEQPGFQRRWYFWLPKGWKVLCCLSWQTLYSFAGSLPSGSTSEQFGQTKTSKSHFVPHAMQVFFWYSISDIFESRDKPDKYGDHQIRRASLKNRSYYHGTRKSKGVLKKTIFAHLCK